MLPLFEGFPLPPPPPDPDHVARTTEGFAYFMMGYLLFVMCVLWILPRRWTDWILPRRGE